MTREQAIEAFDRNTNIHDRLETPRWIDRFVALGMLKLDEPKSAEDRAIEVLEAAMSDPRCGPHQLLTRLEACGLKIVHK